MSKEILAEWANIDQKSNFSEYQTYLKQVSAWQAAKLYKEKTFAQMHVQPGHHVLDVGCGNGDDVRSLAALVGDKGFVIGIDHSEKLVEGANANDKNAGLALKFQVGDAQKLDFPDNSFDSCRADRVFQHLPSRERALAEMIRVTRSGGWIVIADPDWETLLVDMPLNQRLARRILNYIADHTPLHRWAGRELYRLFKQAQLNEIIVTHNTVVLTDLKMAAPLFYLHSSVAEMVAKQELTHEEANEWLTYLEQADREDHFFSSLGGFIVAGQKP